MQAIQATAKFARKNTVMVIAFLAAAVTMFFVPIDEQYVGYFDAKTLVCLFCVLAVVCALRDVNFFYMLAGKLVERFKTIRSASIALVYITFIGSMLIANDMALLTFLPLGFIVLKTTGFQKYMAFVFIMQNIAANLGGMLTPFGNPQNLYLYSKFNIPTLEFMGIMLVPFLVAVSMLTLSALFFPSSKMELTKKEPFVNPQNLYLYSRFDIANLEFIKIMAAPFAFAVILITACCFFIKPEPIKPVETELSVPKKKTAVLLLLFALSIAIVFRGIPYIAGLIIPLALMFIDRKALKNVDYPLLFTFVFFFIFAGNMARIEPIKELLSSLLEKNTLLFSVISCQFISNVPSAVLLSNFTVDYPSLLVGVNIGGVGTLISSLASLITFREYTKNNPGKTAKYVALFSVLNFGFLIALTAFSLAIV